MIFEDWLRIGGCLVSAALTVMGLFDGFRSILTGAKSTMDGILHIAVGLLFLWLAKKLIELPISRLRRWWRWRQNARRLWSS